MANRKSRKPRPAQTAGFSRAELQALQGAQDKSEQSTPQAIVDAFVRKSVSAGGYELQPCFSSTLILLRAMDNVLVKTEDPRDMLSRLPDVFRGLVVFSRPIAVARDLFERGKLDAVMYEIADVFPPAYINKLVEALNDEIKKCFKTLVPHGPKGEGESSGNFPSAAVAPGTAG